MDETKAIAILKALADGVHPLTGHVLPVDSPYQSAEIVRALYTAIFALDPKRRKSTSRRGTPANAGKQWTDEEDRKLLHCFDDGVGIADLAKLHDRTEPGIQARLERHGRLTMSSSWRTGRRSAPINEGDAG